MGLVTATLNHSPDKGGIKEEGSTHWEGGDWKKLSPAFISFQKKLPNLSEGSKSASSPEEDRASASRTAVTTSGKREKKSRKKGKHVSRRHAPASQTSRKDSTLGEARGGSLIHL